LYVAIVTSFPAAPGRNETRYPGSPFVVSGDLAIDLSLNPAHSPDDFSYDYGVDICHEIRPSSGDATCSDAAVGTEVYRTANSDWYVGTPRFASDAGGELTNFDPNYSGFSGEYLGEANVTSYEYVFDGGLVECGAATYVIEATIPRALLVDLSVGDEVLVSWVEGCRNDGNQHGSILRFTIDTPADIDHGDIPGGDFVIPEPAAITLFALGAVVAYLRRRHS